MKVGVFQTDDHAAGLTTPKTGFDSRQGGDGSRLSSLNIAFGVSTFCIPYVQGFLFPEGKGDRIVKLNIHHLLPRLVMSGSVSPFLLTTAGGTVGNLHVPYLSCVLSVLSITSINTGC